MSKNILIIHGPNLNMLGKREVDIYGKKSLSIINKEIIKYSKTIGFKPIIFFSNIEGEIVEIIQKYINKIDAIIVNLAGYSYTSVAILDALKIHKVPIIEVHLSNVFSREEFRQKSLISTIAKGVISGFDHYGYIMALNYLKFIFSK